MLGKPRQPLRGAPDPPKAEFHTQQKMYFIEFKNVTLFIMSNILFI